MSDTSRGETTTIKPTVTDWLKVEHTHQYSVTKFDPEREADLLCREGLGIDNPGHESWALFLGNYLNRFRQASALDYTLKGYLGASRSLLKEVATTRGLIISLEILGGADVKSANEASYAALDDEPANVIDYEELYEPDFWGSSFGLRLRRVSDLTLKFARGGGDEDFAEARYTARAVLLDEAMLTEGYITRHGNVFPVPGVSSSEDPEPWNPSIKEIQTVRSAEFAANLRLF